MAKITAAMVKELRETTGAGMMDCKKALTATDGDKEKAIDWLREKGISKAEKKAGRIAAEGAVATSSSALSKRRSRSTSLQRTRLTSMPSMQARLTARRSLLS